MKKITDKAHPDVLFSPVECWYLGDPQSFREQGLNDEPEHHFGDALRLRIIFGKVPCTGALMNTQTQQTKCMGVLN